jgi:hypothetical protein
MSKAYHTRGDLMSRGFGRVERMILEALGNHPAHHTSLLRLSALVEGAITHLEEPGPWTRLPSRPCRASVARAVRTLERNGLVTAVAMGRSEYPCRGKELWLTAVEERQLPTPLRWALAEKRAGRRG